MSDKKLYGVFSLEAYSTLPPIQLRVGKTLLKVEANGSRYSTPDGKEVLATCVSENPSFDFYEWKDKVFLGEVCKYLGPG